MSKPRPHVPLHNDDMPQSAEKIPGAWRVAAQTLGLDEQALEAYIQQNAVDIDAMLPRLRTALGEELQP